MWLFYPDQIKTIQNFLPYLTPLKLHTPKIDVITQFIIVIFGLHVKFFLIHHCGKSNQRLTCPNCNCVLIPDERLSKINNPLNVFKS